MANNNKRTIHYVRCDESGYGHYMIVKCRSYDEALATKILCEQLSFVRKAEICDSETNEWNHTEGFYKTARAFKKDYGFSLV